MNVWTERAPIGWDFEDTEPSAGAGADEDDAAVLAERLRDDVHADRDALLLTLDRSEHLAVFGEHSLHDVGRRLLAEVLVRRHLANGIADLDAEDGSFHGPGIDVHHGFERGVLRTALVAAGFLDVRIDDCFVVEKGSRRYPVFLAICRKP